MDEHTTSFNNFHTQLLLQMQTNSNIKDLKDQLQSTKTELMSTKEILKTQQFELETTKRELFETKLKLEQTMEQLKQSKEDVKTKENQLNFQQKNIQQRVEKGLMLNHQISEVFATFNLKQDLTPAKLFKSLNTKEKKELVTQITSIEPVEINEIKLDFQKVNELVQNLNILYEEKYQLLLHKMNNGQIYHIDNKQLIFKLHLQENYQTLWINHYNNINETARSCLNMLVMMNDQLVLLNDKDHCFHSIVLQIPNYNNYNSKCYLYHKNTNKKDFLLKYSSNNLYNVENYKTTSNEVLFYITKS